MSVITNLRQLYEIDEVKWLEETVKLLKDCQFEALDLENLIEELEDLGNEKKNAVVSLLDQIIRHLLLLEYWAEERDYRANHWKSEIYNFRLQLQRRRTKTLYNHLTLKLDSIYSIPWDSLKLRLIKKLTFPQNVPTNLSNY